MRDGGEGHAGAVVEEWLLLLHGAPDLDTARVDATRRLVDTALRGLLAQLEPSLTPLGVQLQVGSPGD